MDPNSARAEAERWLGISEKLLASRDLVGSRSFAIRAHESDPTNPISDQIIAIVDTLMAAEKRVINSGNHDWYAILQLPHLVRDPDLIASHYRRLAFLLNPEHNHLPYADFAIRVVFDAWSVLSDSTKKWMYDSELSIFLHRTSDPEPVRVDSSSSSAETYQFFHQPPPPPQQQQQQQQQWIHHIHQQQQPQPQLQEQQLFQQQQQQQQPPAPQSQWLSQTHSQLQQLLPEQQRPSASQWLPQQQQQHLTQAPPPQQPPPRPPQWLPEQHLPVPQQQIPQQQVKEQQIPAQFQRQQPVVSQILPQLQRHQPQPQPQQEKKTPIPQLLQQEKKTLIPQLPQPQQEKKTPIPPLPQPQPQQEKETLILPQPQPQQEKKTPIPPLPPSPPPAPAQTTPPHRPLQQMPQSQELPKENNVRSKEDGIGRVSNVTKEKLTHNGNDSANVTENDNNHDGGVHVESFWTACPYCYHLYEYAKAFQDCILRCQKCRRAFQAMEVPNPPGSGDESSFCSWGFFPIGFSMASWKNSVPNANGFGSNWVPFSPMFACPVQQGAKTKKWTIIDASDEDEDLDLSSDDSDSSGEWGSNKKKVKRANGKSKKGRPVRSNAGIQQMANQHSANGGNSQIPRNEVVASGSLKKQTGKGVRGRKKLDLNVEFSNEVEDPAAVARDSNGEEVGFFEGLDEFLSTLPILDVVGDDKAKES